MSDNPQSYQIRKQGLRKLLEKLKERDDLTQNGAAGFVGVDDRTMRRWAADDSPVPLAVPMLFAVMIEFGLDRAQVMGALRRRTR